MFLGCRWQRTIFLQTSRQKGRIRRTKTWTKRTISSKCEAVGSKWGSTIPEKSVKEFTKIEGNTTSYSMNGIKANARILLGQDVDMVLKNTKLKILGRPHDEVLITTDSLCKHYRANEDRILLKDSLLFRKYFGETGSVKYYQDLILKQSVNEVLRSLHGEFGKHPGITKTIIAYKEKY